MAILFSISKATLGLFGVMCWVLTAESLKCQRCILYNLEDTACPDGRSIHNCGQEDVCVNKVVHYPNKKTAVRFLYCMSESEHQPIQSLRNRCATHAERRSLNEREHAETTETSADTYNEITELCGCDTNFCRFKGNSATTTKGKTTAASGEEDYEDSSGPSHKTSFTSVISLLFLFAEYFSSMFVQ